jgi:hypothetical protein
MSTLKTTNISHPDSPTPQIAMTSNSMVFDASDLSFTGGTLDLPANTTIDGGPLVDAEQIAKASINTTLFLMGG